MQIHIHRDGEDFGPYSRETALEYIERGIFQATDYAWHAGLTEWKAVEEVLGIGAATQQPLVLDMGGLEFQTESPQPWENAAAGQESVMSRRASAPVREKRSNLMILLNMGLVLVVVGVAYVKLGNGEGTARKGFAELSALFASLAAEKPEEKPTPAPIPAIAEAPVTIVSPVAPFVRAASPAGSSVAPVAPVAPAATNIESMDPNIAAALAPALSVVSIPAPIKPIARANLAVTSGAWIKTQPLNEPTVPPVVLNTQAFGTLTLPLVAVVIPASTQPAQSYSTAQGGTQSLSPKETDLNNQAVKVAAVAESAPAITETASSFANPPPAAITEAAPSTATLPAATVTQAASSTTNALASANDQPASDQDLPGLGPQSPAFFARLAGR